MVEDNGLEQIELGPGIQVLIYGIGNVGRRDDGLGIRLVEKLEAEFSHLGAGVHFECNYQLGLEDSLLLAGFDAVIFVDATRQGNAMTPFSISELQSAQEFAFTTHAMSFSTVLSLCEELYSRRPRTYLMAVPGYEWEIGEGLSARASQNLESAYAAIAWKLLEQWQSSRPTNAGLRLAPVDPSAHVGGRTGF
jgi:hydrogenase maturation protease